MANWIHKLFNPHCEHCLEERELSIERQTIEFLQQRIVVLEQERKDLLSKIFEPKVEVERQPVKIDKDNIIRRNPPIWSVKRQMLEAEDKAKAEAIKKAAKPDSMKSSSVEELEKDLDIVSKVEETTEDKLNDENATGTV